MNRRTPLVLVTLGLALGMVACEDRNAPAPLAPATTTHNTTRSDMPGPVPDTSASSRNADNTARNHPEQATSTKTPIDQSESQSDINITAAIRQGILKQSNMSMNAQNCKIITANGVVTLRGPVATAAEKAAIGDLARQTTGVTRVENLLEVNVK